MLVIECHFYNKKKTVEKTEKEWRTLLLEGLFLTGALLTNWGPGQEAGRQTG